MYRVMQRLLSAVMACLVFSSFVQAGGQITLRPVIVKGSAWDNEDGRKLIQAQIDRAKKKWAKQGIQLDALPVETLPPGQASLTYTTYSEGIKALAKDLHANAREIPVVFTDTIIPWWLPRLFGAHPRGWTEPSLVKDNAPVILISSEAKRNPGARRDLTHELAHVLLRDPDDRDEPNGQILNQGEKGTDDFLDNKQKRKLNAYFNVPPSPPPPNNRRQLDRSLRSHVRQGNRSTNRSSAQGRNRRSNSGAICHGERRHQAHARQCPPRSCHARRYPPRRRPAVMNAPQAPLYYLRTPPEEVDHDPEAPPEEVDHDPQAPPEEVYHDPQATSEEVDHDPQATSEEVDHDPQPTSEETPDAMSQDADGHPDQVQADQDGGAGDQVQADQNGGDGDQVQADQDGGDGDQVQADQDDGDHDQVQADVDNGDQDQDVDNGDDDGGDGGGDDDGGDGG